MENQYSDRLEFAKTLAREMGEITMKFYGKNPEVHKVPEKMLVTEADLAVSRHVTSAISSKYPEDSMLTEESDRVKKDSEFEWVIDEIDGTNNFTRVDPHFANAVGLRHKDKVVVGVVYLPSFDELYYASEGCGAYVDRGGETKRLEVGKESRHVFTPSFAVTIDYRETEKYDMLVKAIRDRGLSSGLFKQFSRRMLESTSCELCFLAAGRYDAHFNNHLKAWDIVPGEIIVKEAGGRVTYFGKENKPELFLASNGVLHNELSDIIKNVLGLNVLD